LFFAFTPLKIAFTFSSLIAKVNVTCGEQRDGNKFCKNRRLESVAISCTNYPEMKKYPSIVFISSAEKRLKIWRDNLWKLKLSNTSHLRKEQQSKANSILVNLSKPSRSNSEKPHRRSVERSEGILNKKKLAVTAEASTTASIAFPVLSKTSVKELFPAPVSYAATAGDVRTFVPPIVKNIARDC
jgi:hypothetical protein